MEGKSDLLTQDAPPVTDCNGIDCPTLIKEDMIAQEEENKHKTDKHELNEAENAEKDTNYDADNEEYNDDIPLATDVQFNVAGDENKEPETETIQPSNEKGNDNEGYTENDEKLHLEDEQQPKDKDKAKEEDEKCLHVENGEMKEVASEEKENEGDKEQQMERTKPKENKVEEQNPEDGNNNFNTKEDSGKKERILRARFSSEVRIEPKAYFQAGTDAVVTLPPSSTPNDVFDNETNHSYPDSLKSSSHFILSAKPSESTSNVNPPTFYPLTLFSCLFCCPMIGLFAVYKSYSVNKLISQGELVKANEASEEARQLGILTLIVGFFFALAVITIAVLVSIFA